MAWKEVEYSSFLVHKGCVPAVGSLSAQLMTLPEVDGLQQFPVLKTGLSKKTQMTWFHKEFYLIEKKKSFNGDFWKWKLLLLFLQLGRFKLVVTEAHQISCPPKHGTAYLSHKPDYYFEVAKVFQRDEFAL